MGTILVGTSGWSYDDWRGSFYPTGVPRARWFDHYRSRFSTVEINYSFYRLPSVRTIEAWRRDAPPGFRFAMKGSRLITHARRLANCDDALATYLARVEGLRSFLGPILWQLPPGLEKDLDRLDAFLGLLPRRLRHAIEFRHRSWLDEEVFAVLRRRSAASVAVSWDRFPKDLTVTADFVYVRFHGLTGGYAHDYSRRELRPWADFLRGQADAGRDGYAYFNNDHRARAPKNAAELAAMVAG